MGISLNNKKHNFDFTPDDGCLRTVLSFKSLFFYAINHLPYINFVSLQYECPKTIYVFKEILLDAKSLFGINITLPLLSV